MSKSKFVVSFAALAFALAAAADANALDINSHNNTTNNYDNSVTNQGGQGGAGGTGYGVGVGIAGAASAASATGGNATATIQNGAVRNTNTNLNVNETSVRTDVRNTNAQGQLQGQLQGQQQGQSQTAIGEGASVGSGNGNGSNNTTINVPAPKTYRPVVSSAVAPTVFPTAPCMGSSSAGVQSTLFGISGGTSWESKDCMILETARNFEQAGYAADALAVRCQGKYAKVAPSCQALEAGKAAATPEKSAKAETEATDAVYTPAAYTQGTAVFPGFATTAVRYDAVE